MSPAPGRVVSLLWGLGRYHQTAHRFNRPLERVTITNPIHPLHGQSVVVRQIRHLGKSIKVIAEHPDGGLISLAASETNLEPNQPVSLIRGKTPLFDPNKLLGLAEWVQRKDIQATNEISSGQEHLDVVHRIQDDTTPRRPQNPDIGTGRPHPALNQPDGEVGGQNARFSTTSTEPTGEPN